MGQGMLKTITPGVAVVVLVTAAGIHYSAPASAGSELKSPVVDTGQSECYDNYRRVTCPRKGRRFYGQDARYHGLQRSCRDNGDGIAIELNTGGHRFHGFRFTTNDDNSK